MQFTDSDDQRFWFYNSMHFPEPMSAFDMVTAEAAYVALGAANTRVHSLPTTKGIDYRILNGRVYIGGVAVTDPDELAKRTEEFQKRAFYYYEHWEELYGQWREKMLALIKDAQAIEVPELPEFEPLEHVHAGRGVALNHYVLDAWHKTIEGYFRMWHHHFEFLLLGYGAYLVFFDFCKKAFPEIADQTIARMVAGMEGEMFRPDDELRALARKAVELGVDGQFVEGASPDEILTAMQNMGSAGVAWLEAFDLVQVNEDELRVLSAAGDGTRDRAEDLLADGPDGVFVTLGTDGVEWVMAPGARWLAGDTAARAGR